MIRTLVVDDDFHVARAHTRSVEKVPGFTVVGEARSAGEAQQLITQERPDLLLLDMYLPDRTGLDLIRELAAAPGGGVPDFILITAARDIESVRAAIQLGAIYYLVKPFAFAALREQLEAYRQWRQRLSQAREADQETVDTLYSMLHSPATHARQRRKLPATMARVLEVVSGSPEPLSAADVAESLGFSRPTAQRYLGTLVQRGLLDLNLSYGTTGRPEHRFTPHRT
ncbi:response regulator of citrate/malate metabolism [Kribbella aluminosa]|uniref:Transcriptional regulatory protein n=1 Tax=Kribbella aluminosa TaxID=416017 RepID=A0ABS4UCV2_9ACTN|nr:response regulator [Kribbella aluminosa]MBP2349436.1 response regulator of citrate/malate metabolism [Kribbella aluminosa]